MAINGNVITSLAVTENTALVIEMLSTRPELGGTFTPARPAGQLCGYYDASTDSVELYVVNASGIRFLRIG